MTGGRRALDGIRVIDFGQYIAAPLTTLLLAENGADVIRVDPPGGPIWDHPANAVLQRSKRSVILDLHDASDLATARKLVSGADVVVEGFRPGVMSRLGLSPAHAAQIWCSVPGFGRDDPRAGLEGWEGIVSSAAGLYPAALFDTQGDPWFSALPVASTFAAAIAAHSVMAALIARERSGRGERIEVPLFDAAFYAIGVYGEEPHSIAQIGLGYEQNQIKNPAFVAGRPYRCRDGRYLAHWGVPPRGLHRFWDAHLPPELKYRTDPEAEEQARESLSALFSGKDAEEWERVLQKEYGAAVGTCKSSAEWLQDEHALASDTIVEVDDPLLGISRQPGFVVGLTAMKPAITSPRRIPGADTAAVESESSSGPAPAPIGDGAVDPEAVAPLSGVRVLDFTHILAGPIMGRVLAEYGAEVIKINNASIGFGEADPDTDDLMAMVGHRTTNAGKRSMFLDLKSTDGQEILRRLVQTADVVLVNTPAAGARRLGLDEASLRQVNERLIYGSLTLHASGGWRSSFVGHEDVAEDVSGISMRYCGGVPDRMHGIIVNDHGTGHFAAFGILLALFARDRAAAAGETVESSLSQTATFMQLPFMLDFPGVERREPQGPAATGWSTTNRLYATQDGWLWVSAGRLEGVQALAKAVGLDSSTQTDDPDSPAAAFETAFRRRTTLEWESVLEEHGIARHAYRNISELMNDPISVSRGMSVTVDHPGIGMGRQLGMMRRFASRPDASVAPAVKPGSDTRDVLREVGYPDAEIDRLILRRVVATADDSTRSARSEDAGNLISLARGRGDGHSTSD